MKIIRTMLLVLIATLLLTGLTSTIQAQDAADPAKTAPADKAAPTADAPAATDDDTLTEDDESGSETADESDQTPAGGGTSTTKPAAPESPSLFNPQMMLPIAGVLFLFWWMGRGKRKGEAKRKEMLSAMKKGDKVTTIGGIIGTITDIKDNEVTVKVDESTNTRMRFARRAVHVIGNEAKEEKTDDKK